MIMSHFKYVMYRGFNLHIHVFYILYNVKSSLDGGGRPIGL
jgi:hypothetical protein